MRKLWKLGVLSFCLLTMLCQQYANAQAALAPVENYVVNRAIGGIIANRIAIARGAAANDAAWLATAANDPVYKATMAGVSRSMTTANVASTALGVGLAIAGAPVWLSVAATMGVIGLGVWIAYDNSLQSSISIQAQNGGNKIVVTSKPATLPAYPFPSLSGEYGIDKAVSQGAKIYRHPTKCVSGLHCYVFPPLPANTPMKYTQNTVDGGAVVLVANNVTELGKYYVVMTTPNFTWSSPGIVYVMESSSSGFTYSDDGTPHWYVWKHESRQGCALPACDPVNGLPNYDRTYFEYASGGEFLPGSYPGVYPDLDKASAALSSDLKALKVAPYVISEMVNRAWQNAAASPGYAGEPYPASNPVTTTDVSTWTAANPNSVPTLDDMLRPAQNPQSNPDGVPISPTIQTSTTTNPGTGVGPNVNVVNTPNVNVANSPRVDMGPDPATPEPTLENTPTATEILNPLTKLFPELRSYQAPSHTGECPKPSFDIFGKSIVMDSHCTIAEQHRATLAAVMIAVWMLIGLLILLSA